MSRALEERVWQAAPLALADRCVLLAVAREVEDGRTEVVVSREALARRLQATTAQVLRGLRAGEAIRLVTLLRQGGVAFTAYDQTIGVEPPPARPSGVAAPARPLREDAAPVERRVPPPQLLAAFAAAWQARYRQTYVFTPGKDQRLAKALLVDMTLAEAARRAQAYVASDDDFYVRCKHAFSVFVSRVNEFARAPRQQPRADTRTQDYLARMRAGRD